MTLILFLSINSVIAREKSALHQIIASDSMDMIKYIYKVGHDDVLTIQVYDNPDLTGDFTVSTDGKIVFPLLGQIKVAGLDEMEIQEMLTEKLGRDYLYNPVVSVTIKLFRSKVVYILGNIGKPGIYYLERPTRLFDLLSKAEGLSKDIGQQQNGQRIRIMREALMDSTGRYPIEKETSFFISFYQFLIEGKRELNIYLREGDVIYLPGQQLVYVVGEVKKPGSFPYEEGMTVLKAITLAGGSNGTSAVRSTVITRIENNKELKIKVTMSDLLKPDDIISVPISKW